MVLDYKIIGVRIKAKRVECNLTQELLAEKVDISWRTISNIERGVSEPKLSTLYNICKALSLSLDDILEIQHTSKPLNRLLLEVNLLNALQNTSNKDLELLTKFIQEYK